MGYYCAKELNNPNLGSEILIFLGLLKLQEFKNICIFAPLNG